MFKDYLELCKPKVVALMMLTTMVGMCLATRGGMPWVAFIAGNCGIGLAAAAAAVVNHWVDRRLDRLMQRTEHRPLVQGKISPKNAIIFAVVLSLLSMVILISYVNLLTAVLTFFTMIAYAGIYTGYLKHATSQNIVIGGVAGAAPPLLGWAAITGQVDPQPLVLMLIIFVWTPPHFWALAIDRIEDYAKANVPMLPITHGIPFTKRCILLYTCLLTAITLLPFAIGMSGWIYLGAAILLDARFLYLAVQLFRSKEASIPMKTFRYSILYLMGLFVALLADHYFYLTIGGMS